jgi:NADH-quinone oxidoreductase subunit A
MYTEFAAVLIFILLGCAFVGGSLVLGWLIRPRKGNVEKQTIYECGEPTIGSAWIRFNSRFYNIALVYLLFDVEVVVLVPAFLVVRDLKAAGLGAAAGAGLLFFIGLLVLGLAYEWFWGNLNWIHQVPPGEETPPNAPAAEGQAS